MRSRTLTQTIRENITELAVKSSLSKRIEKLKVEEQELAEMIYGRIYDEVTQYNMNKLSANFFHSTSKVYVTTAGKNTRWPDSEQLVLKSSRRIAANHYYNSSLQLYVDGLSNMPFEKRLFKFIKDRKQLELDRKTLEIKISGMLSGLRTVKQLQNEWPSGLKFYKGYLEEPLPNLPCVRGDEIDTLIEGMER